MHAPTFGSLPDLAGLSRRLVNLLLPVACAICETPLTDDPVPFFCRRCWAGISPLTGPLCPRCGRPFSSPLALAYAPQHNCARCRLAPPVYTQARAWYSYEPPLQEAIQLFKYHGKVALADFLGALAGARVLTLPPADVVMPVPLHASRLRSRGFNQALLLADRMNRHLRLPVSYDNLVRIRLTQPQTELSRKARLRNLRRAFVVQWPDEIKDQRVLLVDDVITTGTTINECAKALRKAGAAEVYVCALARTL
jgi:ComF family protein